jgi:hypothetical protein
MQENVRVVFKISLTVKVGRESEELSDFLLHNVVYLWFYNSKISNSIFPILLNPPQGQISEGH